MPIVTLDHLKIQLNFTDDIGDADDDLLTAKIEAAQAHIEQMLGYAIADRFGGEELPPVPADLCEAVLQLAAWWYENRETAGPGAKEVPFGVSDIVMGRRDWSF
jgi:hypothetical protein